MSIAYFSRNKRRESILPFDLSSLLIACAIVAACFLLVQCQRPGTEELALKVIRSRGATVATNLGGAAGADERRVEIAMTGPRFKDEDVPILQAVPSLRRLDLSNSFITDECTAVLSRLLSLESLNVTDTVLSDDGIELLQLALPNCKIAAHRRGDGSGTMRSEEMRLEVVLDGGGLRSAHR